jgi:hypothetical protein
LSTLLAFLLAIGLGSVANAAAPDKPGSEGPAIAEYCSEPATSPFPSPSESLRLPVKETPDAVWDDPSKWASVDDFGTDPTGQKDSAAAVQKAMDSGAATVFLPGSYNLRSTVTIGAKVRRIVGLGGTINYGKGLRPDLRLSEGEAPVVFLEHFAHIHGGLEIATPRTVVLRSVQDCIVTSTPAAEGGELFFEDVVTHGLRLRKQRLWARQLNIENEGMHFTNDGRQARPDVCERRCVGLGLLRRGVLLRRPVCHADPRNTPWGNAHGQEG